MKDAERIAELEAALRRSELLVEQLQAQLNLGRKRVRAAQASAAQSAPAGEREAFELAMDEHLHKEYRAAALAKAFDFHVPTEVWRAGYIAGIHSERAAWQRAQSAGVPEGYALVPIDPTPKMLVAYMGTDGAVKRWKAMVAAAKAEGAHV